MPAEAAYAEVTGEGGLDGSRVGSDGVSDGDFRERGNAVAVGDGRTDGGIVEAKGDGIARDWLAGGQVGESCCQGGRPAEGRGARDASECRGVRGHHKIAGGGGGGVVGVARKADDDAPDSYPPDRGGDPRDGRDAAVIGDGRNDGGRVEGEGNRLARDTPARDRGGEGRGQGGGSASGGASR